MPIRQRILVDFASGCFLFLVVCTQVWAQRTARAVLEQLPKPPPVQLDDVPSVTPVLLSQSRASHD